MWRPPATRLGRHTRAHNVLLVTPWADQGLGIQAREYAHQALAAGWGVFVWALRCRKTSDVAQVAAAEWQIAGVEVVDAVDESWSACVAYCQDQQITDILVLEPARKPIFDAVQQLSAVARVWAVPNIEMIRRSDLPLFRYFTGVLCVNQHTVDNLEYFKVPRLQLMRFRIRPDPLAAQAAPCTDMMRFLLVGGYNADRRKQAKKVMLAFSRAFRDRSDVQLTVLSQGGPDFAQIPRTFPNIQVRTGALTYAQILAAYAQHHVVLMCSRAEGLGLPFYEAARAGCAVITLDMALYREQVDFTNGWLVKSSVEPVAPGQAAIGNDEAIVHTYTFDPLALAQVFQTLTPAKIAAAQAAARQRYDAVPGDNFFLDVAKTHAGCAN